MKILVCSAYYYYGSTKGIEPQFYYLYKVPEAMGHTVDFFDFWTANRIGVEQMRRQFISTIKGGSYDAVFIATHSDEFDKETLEEAKKYTTTIAWNSDDEWRWENYSKERVNWYTYMVTNSQQIYDQNKASYSNLLHAQWACTGFWDGSGIKKDIDFSFAGQVYGKRAKQVNYLRKHSGLVAFGKGSGTFTSDLADQNNSTTQKTSLKQTLKPKIKKSVRKYTPKLLIRGFFASDFDIISFEQINAIWNRTKVSFTPLDSSDGSTLQIKSRVFDMGLNGTMMLAQNNSVIADYYEPNKEYVPFESLEDAAEKAKFYSKNDTERNKIVKAYMKRTKGEHLWEHRIKKVLQGAKLAA